jgi:hypothetical protein
MMVNPFHVTYELLPHILTGPSTFSNKSLITRPFFVKWPKKFGAMRGSLHHWCRLIMGYAQAESSMPNVQFW